MGEDGFYELHDQPRGPKSATEILFDEVVRAGMCTNPIHLASLVPDADTGELVAHSFRIACKDRRVVLCPSCARTYKTDAWFLVLSGLLGGKGISSEVAQHPRIFATLTAPSFGRVHTIRDDARCNPGRPARCEHGWPTNCLVRHPEDDARLGAPLCEGCFDVQGAVLWNAAAARLWNRTVERLKRRLAATQGLTMDEFRAVAQVNHLRVAEFQRRGLVHLHVVLRADGPEGPPSDPPAWLTAEVLGTELRRAARVTTLGTGLGGVARWGTELDVIDLSADDAGRVAAYVAKYATKTTDGSFGLARRFRERREIARARTAPHLRHLALVAWDLGRFEELEGLHLQRHAHTLGFTGQLVTKSRGFSTTFSELREARARWIAAEHEVTAPDPATSFAYLGRGYSDPRGERLAEILVEFAEEDRQKAAEQRRAARETDPPTVG